MEIVYEIQFILEVEEDVVEVETVNVTDMVQKYFIYSCYKDSFGTKFG